MIKLRQLNNREEVNFCMKSKKILMCFVAILLCFILVTLTGCGGKEEPAKQENKTSQLSEEDDGIVEPIEEPEEDVILNKKNKEEEKYEIHNKEIYNDDLPLGFEFVDLTVNGENKRIQVDTFGNSNHIEEGPYYIDYRLMVGGETVKEGKYHLEGYGITMLREYDLEEDIGVNYEFFERDFTATVYKGEDKEYVAISIPAGIEDENSASLILATDKGDLLGDFNTDTVEGITLTGDDVEKYKNDSGDVVFNSIKDGKISYLTPAEGMYTKDSSGNKVVDSSKNVIDLEEHSIEINNNKVIDTKTDNTYQITGVSGRTITFSSYTAK